MKFINLWQTSEERKQKYHLCRSLGVNSAWAAVIRDWPLAKIERRFHLVFDERHRQRPVLKPYAQFSLPGFPQMIFKAQNPLESTLYTKTHTTTKYSRV